MRRIIAPNPTGKASAPRCDPAIYASHPIEGVGPLRGMFRYSAECLLQSAMAQKYGSTFSRRGPDIVTEELALVLSGKSALEFKPLFDLVYTNLRARKAVSGGEEMLRLRVYEKLQSLVNRGMVKKAITAGIKEYQGLASLASALPVAPLEPLAPILPMAPVPAAATL